MTIDKVVKKKKKTRHMLLLLKKKKKKKKEMDVTVDTVKLSMRRLWMSFKY